MKTIRVCPNDDGAWPTSETDKTFRFITGSAREARPRAEPGLQLRCTPADVEAEVRRLRAGGHTVIVTGPAVAALRRAGIDADSWSEPGEGSDS